MEGEKLEDDWVSGKVFAPFVFLFRKRCYLTASLPTTSILNSFIVWPRPLSHPFEPCFLFKKGVVSNSSPSHYKRNSVIVWPLSLPPPPHPSHPLDPCFLYTFYIFPPLRPAVNATLFKTEKLNRSKLSCNSSKDTVRVQLSLINL